MWWNMWREMSHIIGLQYCVSKHHESKILCFLSFFENIPKGMSLSETIFFFVNFRCTTSFDHCDSFSKNFYSISLISVAVDA